MSNMGAKFDQNMLSGLGSIVFTGLFPYLFKEPYEMSMALGARP